MNVIAILALASILAWAFNKARDSSGKAASAVVENKRSSASGCSDDSAAFSAPCPFRSVSSMNVSRLNTFS